MRAKLQTWKSPRVQVGGSPLKGYWLAQPRLGDSFEWPVLLPLQFLAGSSDEEEGIS